MHKVKNSIFGGNFRGNFYTMESKTLLALDRRSQRKDETYPICLALYHKGTKSYINLKEYVLDDFWDQKNGMVLKGAEVFPSLSWVNSKITGKKVDANRLIKSLEGSGQLNQITHQELRRRIQNKSTQASFSTYLDNLISEFATNGNHGQVRIYTGAKNFLKNYVDPDKDFKFDDINYKLLKTVEGKFKPRMPGCKNGLSVQLRTIRAIWNRAIKEGLVSVEQYPFKDYKIQTSKSHKTAISSDDIRLINGLQLPVNTSAWHCRNMFLFSFHTMGMNFADIACLQVKNIKEDSIIYTRSKTKKVISVQLNDNISKLLKNYIENKAQNDYIFPVIMNIHNAPAEIQAYHSVANHALKRWAKKLSINPSLSFNTARHSWATIGKELDIPIAVLSEGLGHADIGTTQVYLDSFDKKRINDANTQITKFMLQQ